MLFLELSSSEPSEAWSGLVTFLGLLAAELTWDIGLFRSEDGVEVPPARPLVDVLELPDVVFSEELPLVFRMLLFNPLSFAEGSSFLAFFFLVSSSSSSKLPLFSGSLANVVAVVSLADFSEASEESVGLVEFVV